MENNLFLTFANLTSVYHSLIYSISILQQSHYFHMDNLVINVYACASALYMSTRYSNLL